MLMVAGANSCNGSGNIIVAGANGSAPLTAPLVQRLKALDSHTILPISVIFGSMFAASYYR